MGHSYGSTVVAEGALNGDGLAVEDIVVAGSPGMHSHHATELQLPQGHVWSGHAEGDLVSGPGLGHSGAPHDLQYGANRYVVDTHGHSDYWKMDNNIPSESLKNQARIVVGQYEQVELLHGELPK
jgi:hypothetical protein